jgi:hypothetical protein
MENSKSITLNQGAGGDILKDFQLSRLSIAEKSKSEYGIKIAQKIWGTVVSGFGGYFFNRNARFQKNRNYANGRIDVQAQFQDRFDMDGKLNYIRLNWQTLQLVNRIVSGLVGRWMSRGEKIQVNAIDNLSHQEKQKEYEELEYFIYNKEQLKMLEQESGIQIFPQGQDLPESKDELDFWQAEMQRLPEEIMYEMGCNNVLQSNGWYDVLKEKMLHDAAETLFVGTKTDMDKEGVIHVKWVKPENAIYSWSEYPDFRDTTWRGEIPTIKISELRKEFGKEFNPDNPNALSEEELWQIAQTAKEMQYYTNIQWTNLWYTAFLRPYDEWNVRCMRFEIKTVDSEAYTVTNTKLSGRTYVEKGLPKTQGGNLREKPLENQKVVEDTHWNIYEGVYLPDNQKLLKWNLKKNMIRPQDPKESGNAEFSYSFFMPQNYLMRNLAIPEKIEAAIDNMILTLLKMQQVVARMRPTGAAIDETALQNIDYGLGDSANKGIDYKKLYDQTGDIYYRGVDAEGNRVPVPIQELQNTGFLGQMGGLIQIYQFWYQTLKDELGEDPNLISAALQPRVTAGNVEASQIQAEFATDYIYRAYAECMKTTARKISCLLKDSVTYGSKVYREIVKEEDIKDRIFNTNIKFLPNQNEVLRFEQIINQTIAANPDLSLFVDPFKLVRIAKEDVKLAELLFNQGQKKMLMDRQMRAQQNSEQTAQIQMQSAKMAEEEKRKTVEMEIQIKSAHESQISKEKQKEALLTGFMQIYSKGGQVPPELKALEQQIIQNLMMPLVAENAEVEAQMAQAQDDMMMQEEMAKMQEQQQQGQRQEEAMMEEGQQEEGQMEGQEMQEEEQVV